MSILLFLYLCLILAGWFVRLYYLLFLLFWYPVVERHCLEVLDSYLVSHFLLSTLLLFTTFLLFALGHNRLCVWDLLFYLLVEHSIALLWKNNILRRFRLLLHFFIHVLSSIQLGLNLFSKNSLVFLYYCRFVVDVAIGITNYSVFSKVFKGPGVWTFLHIK